MLAPSPIILPVTCVHCGRPVTLQFQNTRSVLNVESIWTCPHADCPTDEQPIQFPGELLDVWIGHTPEASEPPPSIWRES